MVKKIFNSKLAFLVIILLLVVINWGASVYHGNIDFTDEKRFTLSPATVQVLKNLQQPVDITVLLAGDIKSEFKKLSNSTRDLLKNFKNYGGRNIQFHFEVPGDGYSDSAKAMIYDSLISMGLRPTNQQVQVREGEGKDQRQIFPAAILQYNNRSIAIDLLQGQIQKSVFNSNSLLDKQTLNSAEALLEYKFAHAIQQLTQENVPVVAYAYGNGEPEYGVLQINSVFETLGRNFIVDTVNVKTQPFISPEYAALVVVKPMVAFTDEDKFKLDQYVMNGGRLFFLVDVLYAERDSLQQGELVAYSRDLNLNDLLFRYGVRINTDLIADKHCDQIPVEVGSIGGQQQRQLLPWPYAPLLQPGSNHPIVKNQADVLAQFANSIDLVESPGIEKSILLSSSANTSLRSTPARIQLNSMQTIEDISKFDKKNVPVAVLLEGDFTSLYANRITQSQRDTLDFYKIPFLKKTAFPGKVIVVSDADIAMNQVSNVVGPLPMGTNRDTKIQYANKDFFLNCTEYLANKNNILDAKAKDYSLLLLDVEKVEKQKTIWQVINLAGPVFFILLFAALFQWRRKSMYTL
jgi:gliding-associated putative ABC transporter substrate-binding component GldG